MFHKSINSEGQGDSAEWQEGAEHYMIFYPSLSSKRGLVNENGNLGGLLCSVVPGVMCEKKVSRQSE